MATQLVWLRNDLRLTDHPALYGASDMGGAQSITTASEKADSTAASTTTTPDVHIVICMTPEQWCAHSESAAKQSLRVALIDALGKECEQKGIMLHTLHLNTFSECAPALLDLCQSLKCESIWWQSELPFDEQQRDSQVERLLSEHGVTVHHLAPDLIVSQPLLNNQGTPFKVFTPYYRRWIEILKSNAFYSYPEMPSKAKGTYGDVNHSTAINISNEYFANERYRDDIWPANYAHIKETLDSFCSLKEADYEAVREIPSTAGTSLLSPYLALGAVGPRELLSALKNGYQIREEGYWADSIWLKELAWRDFYKQLMWHFPRLSMRQAFKPETEQIIWSKNDTHFQAWCDGQTGFPIVDAAMRQLNQTGWMHNRLRMITASFLTKLLFIDWRKGEDYFMSKLIDGEFAANNGGWQWSASTGCDAVPYFRVFNPTRQSETYDTNGHFIRRFVPELSALSDKEIHSPSVSHRQQCRYPEPIIDYKSARKHAIDAFAEYTHK
ncbi:cryptochrome/photolyase family protein [Marinomonas mediterranea]|uniref:Deoxyribodipyrimidine photo-lyase n=1 Tax=Marinomonas mediterranea (strain ATCC 700492 / JCM 21426 / NBRC 103028 / MMB-1) TaxID=717774 RepID=F2JTA9_MARM1|nr:FAD-binding domain-containing protein [Marinomonas mediterranea]ADZ90327.1 Deoxyribodipyrimidine photo-lyase [Marinomonas mediterranea MMB-1]WCN16515.1 deoxyribodipyrimidine photo-lyase [Marinomonas mediterranea MMB-1]